MNFLFRLPAAIFWVFTIIAFAVISAPAMLVMFIIKLISLGSKSW